MTVTLRPAALADAAGIAHILRATGAELGWPLPEDPAVTRDQVSRHLASCLGGEDHTVLVAASEGDVAGYVAVHWLPYLLLPGPEGYVSELFVRPERRGQGVGRALLGAARAEAERRGCLRLMLLNGRHRESYQRGFYRKAGWDEREEFANFVLRLEPTNE